VLVSYNKSGLRGDGLSLDLSRRLVILGRDCQITEEGRLLAELNYSMPFWAFLFKILEMADVETPNNRGAPANEILNSLINRSAISERTRGILVSVSVARSPGRFTRF